MYFNTMALSIFKGFVLLCVLNYKVDCYKRLGLARRPAKDLPTNYERFYHEKAKLPENSFEQYGKIRGVSSLRKTEGLAKLFKLEVENKDEYGLNSLKNSPREVYHTLKSSTRSKFSLHTSLTAGQRNEKANKDFVFRNVVRNDRLNSYAVAQAPTEAHKGPKWYITVVSSFCVLLVVVALCVYAPCSCLRKLHRNEFDVNCPITASQKGMCGKCYLHRHTTTTKTATYKEQANHVSVTMATNDSRYRPSSGNYSSQYSWAQGTQRPGKLKQAKTKVSSLFKGNHGYQPVEYRRYKPLKNEEKRRSWTYEPEWTSIGAFMNKNPRSGTYGSTKDSEERFVDRYGRRSRDSLDAGEEVVEYALKLRPRKRQVIELKEFPLGYSKSYLNIDLESDPGVVFDPYRDQLHRKKSKASQRLTFSDSDLRKLSCTDKPGNYNDSEDLFNAARPRKSSLKLGSLGKGKANSKVVHFFPSNFNYDAQFVQIPKNKMAETEVGEFERHFNMSYTESRNDFKADDIETSHESSFDVNTTKESSKEFMKLPENKIKELSFNNSKEHAIDCDVKSPTVEVAEDKSFILHSRDCSSSYVNYGCRSSTEVLAGSEETPTKRQEFRTLQGNQESCVKPEKNLESLSSSYTDLYKTDLDYKPEPLAGLMSPIRRAPYKETNDNKGIVTSKTAGDLVCVTSCVQPQTTSKYTAPYGNSIYQPQLDDTTRFKSSQSESEFEDFSLQRFPEKESKKES